MASSDDDDDSSSGNDDHSDESSVDDAESSSEEEEVNSNLLNRRNRNRTEENDDEEVSDDDDDDSTTSDEEDDSSDEEEDGSDTSSDDEEGSDDGSDKEATISERALTMAERLALKADKGYNLSKVRERKNKARDVLRERLESKEVKQKKNLSEKQTKKNTSSKEMSAAKKSKHAPTEVSSKRSDFYSRRRANNDAGLGVDIGANVYKPRDPRMSSLSGHLDMDHFERNFAFVRDLRDQEISQLKKRVEVNQNSGPEARRERRKLGIRKDMLERDKVQLKELESQKAQFERGAMDRMAKRSVKKRIAEEVKTGKRASYHPRRADVKRMHMEAKFDELRKRGGNAAVDKALAKKRKKNKSRDASFFLDSRKSDK